MSSEATPAVLVFARALMLAESSGASEIGVDHLLAALDDKVSVVAPTDAEAGPFLPAPRRQLPLCRDAANAVAPLGDLFAVPVEVLRAALLAAKS